jgi:hypothetical protein
MLYGKLMLVLDLSDATAFFRFALRNRCAESLSLFTFTDDPDIAVDAICNLAERVRKVSGRISGSSSAEFLVASALDARHMDGCRDQASKTRKGIA